MTFRELLRVKNVELTQKYNAYMLFSYVFSTCDIEVFFQIFLRFKFCTSVQISIYCQPLCYYIHYVIDAVPLNAILELYAFRETCDFTKNYFGGQGR